LFTNSLRGDLEAWLTGCRQRFGILRAGSSRPLLTRAYSLPAEFNEQDHHQLALWENFLRHFGLDAPPDRTPFQSAIHNLQSAIGLIAGSENTPEKRSHWRAVIEAFPAARFILFGTAQDTAITTEIAAGFAPSRVENLAGRTDLPALAAGLRECRLLVTNDTGGMHLANALGVPLIGLFGPTNPIRTAPVFTGATCILQPPGCPPTGGGALADLFPAMVIDQVRELLTAPLGV
jgi:ADP-heptose:LPS heptosyltransferase